MTSSSQRSKSSQPHLVRHINRHSRLSWSRSQPRTAPSYGRCDRHRAMDTIQNNRCACTQKSKWQRCYRYRCPNCESGV